MRNFGVRLLLGAVLLVSVAPLPAQRPFSGAAELEESLHKLNELGTVLHIAAHPDDERTAVLAYFARGRHMRTAYLSLTRGEGGQNLIGSEQGAQLGIIRTQELLAARRSTARSSSSRAPSISDSPRPPTRRMQKWGHDRILSDVVWVIRRYRPDVIILGSAARRAMDTGSTRSSAILGKEAFDSGGGSEAVSRTVEVRAAVAGQAPGAGGEVRRLWFGGARRRLPPADAAVHPRCRGQSRRAGRRDGRTPIPARSIRSWVTPMKSWRCSAAACTTARARAPCGVRAPAAPTSPLLAERPASKDLFDGIDTIVESLARRRRGQGHPGRGDPLIRAGASRKGDSAAGEGARR